jgi:hypothetical protein
LMQGFSSTVSASSTASAGLTPGSAPRVCGQAEENRNECQL